jgi:hypothetical protein
MTAGDVTAGGVDVEAVMRGIRERIEEKKRRGLLTDAEVREISARPLHAVLDANEFRTGFLRVLLENRDKWGYSFGPESVYGQQPRRRRADAREGAPPAPADPEALLEPEPDDQRALAPGDLNQTYVHLIHNLAEELTRVNLDVQDLRNRVLQLQGRLELHARREKALEALLAEATLRRPGPSGRG